jgi:hypothetical protein
MNKLIKACIALAAFAAFAVLPASASAVNSATLVEQANTSVLPVGTNILATNEKTTTKEHGVLVMTNSEGQPEVECTGGELTGTVTSNTHTLAQGEITKAAFGGKPGGTTTGHCKGIIGDTLVTVTSLPWCMSISAEAATDTFQLRGGKCSEASKPITFTLHITSIFGTISCHYARSSAITGTYHTHPNQAYGKVTKVEFLRESTSDFGCPASGFLDQEFKIYKEEGGVHKGAVSILKAT